MVPVHGCSCKLPQYQLGGLLERAGLTGGYGETVLAGAWENSSVVKIAGDLGVLSTLDFFTPMVDEPEVQGRIAASNVTSDIYTLGVTNIVSLLSIMAYPEDLPDELAVGMLKGLNDFCREMGIPLTGGHTTRCPWPIIGGAAIGVNSVEGIVYTRGAKLGDLLFLTKPLGIAPAMAAYRLRKEETGGEGKELLADVSEELVENAVNTAIDGMISSNKPAAQVMQKIPVHAATDITGFGLKGHAENMARLSNVDIIINNLYVIPGTPVLSEQLGYPLLTGEAKETAGGILMAVSKENADDLQSEFDKHKVRYCQVGYVTEGKGDVHVSKNVEITEKSA
ncbi:MAG: selenide, water dikinase SelD [Candidatus Bathyarchaeota archaeon]|nr:selenide, water dikinase SelD [Candidatus Termiticorpusculum sp.]MCL1970020.1 selenide, water dikinase SelD [Candidatus Termiticorpusculum sp.]